MKSFAQLMLASSLLAWCGTPALYAQREKLPPEDLEYVEKTWPDAKKTNTGIRYIIMQEGQGEAPKPGDPTPQLHVEGLHTRPVPHPPQFGRQVQEQVLGSAL